MSYSSVVLSDSPLGYWRLDESSGTTFADSSGNGHTATITGSFTFSQAAAASIDGTSVNDAAAGYATVGSSFLTTASIFSVEAWVKSSDTTHIIGIMGRHGAGGATGTAHHFQFRLNNGKPELIVFASDGTAHTIAGPSSIADGAWHHVVATSTPTGTNNVNLYIDGTNVAAASTTAAGQFLTDTSTALWLGDCFGSLGNHFNGGLDELAIYGAVLTSTQVAAHNSTGRTSTQTLAPTGIASAGAFGSATVTPGAVTVAPTGITTAEVFGTPLITVGAVGVAPVGIPSAEAFGSATVTPGAVAVEPVGIASEEAFGVPTITVTVHTLGPTGIPSEEAFGTPVITALSTSHVYTEFALAALKGELDLSSDTIKAMPLSAYTVGSTRDDAVYVADVLAVATESSGGSYSSGGVALTGVTITKVLHSQQLTCGTIVFSTTVDIAATHILFFDSAGGSDATNRVILFWDLGVTTLLSGITPDPVGVLVATAA